MHVCLSKKGIFPSVKKKEITFLLHDPKLNSICSLSLNVSRKFKAILISKEMLVRRSSRGDWPLLDGKGLGSIVGIVSWGSNFCVNMEYPEL